MELLNATRMQAGHTLGMEPSGRESLVVVVKGTFRFPTGQAAEELRLADAQAPLVEADAFTGEPGLSAPVYESDYPLRKPRCDIVLNGSAYAPDGRQATVVPVSLTVGSIRKAFNVVGDRVWVWDRGTLSPTPPQPFQVLPISYDRAFGGTDTAHPDPARHAAFMPNPVGVGFHANLDRDLVHGRPLPNTEAAGEQVSRPDGTYRPMAFGPIGRGWEPRYRLAGTYDQDWIDNVFPFLPADFQEACYQCAPQDQQTDYLRGGELVELMGLTPSGKAAFRLPRVEVPVVFFYKRGGRHETQAVADTLVLEPDQGRLMITWRASLALKRNIFEIPQVLAGKMPRGWWRARQLGKTYYPSLAHLPKRRPELAAEAEE